jgi:lipopolysaccharide biosynthesis regulator YciM
MMDGHNLAIFATCLAATGQANRASEIRQAQIAAGSRHAAFYCDEAIYLRDANRLDEALQVLDRATQVGIANEYPLSVRASILERQGKGEEASRLRQAQIAAGSRHAAFYCDQAIYLRDANRLDEALQVLDKAERAGIANKYTLSVRASILERQGKGEEASRLRQAQIAAGSRDAVFYHDEAIYLRDANRPDEALQVLDKAERAGIADEYTLSVRASILERLGEGEEASRLRQAQIAAGSRNAVFYHDEAIYLRDANRPDEALQVLDRAERAGIVSEYLLSVRASILERLGEGEEASRLRQAQIAAGSRHAAFYCDEAVYLRDANRLDEALQVLDRAEQAGIANKYTLSVRASILERQGKGALA